ncbi:acyl carrier protein [Burkholderia thailandensis]|uniref:Phosphopantetheine attachment site domain protein n=1 Tax=Burkholderia thailandensis (strain ATCC 700388 / DSM 13276 / CCUG 48851 / CIP 106301 / E264) TaxID=271848 RepID=Q2T5Y4_BURTA|nr:acyl carrier protein [Burkholderia thailandensis]ABC34369.1 phosphopantetheine attachment site domain protein [Burkholderia thailandensis E264]AHI75635.1 phosphopantetheine attachment site family protein [Burkholderia thailandensis 2002721723]AHI81900.1 phosphopantetheine attachment site family protein [Burkholderia thailandensis E444]AIC90445.1 phosphopantetheine attachment site family protein [Burkholderia thailandensis USAMRU Malaysia \
MNMTSTALPPTADAIERWLIGRIAAATGCAAAAIDPDKAMEAYGLTSVIAVGLSAELEDWLGIDVDATIVWDYPTVAGLAAHLADALRAR